MKSSVRVMRSYDYCHFEIALERECNTLEDVNTLRQEAAILVDEAVRQFIVAKAKESTRLRKESETRLALERVKYVETIPQSEWTVEQAALMKAYNDKSFWDNYKEEQYDYWDDSETDHHFSMLQKFKDSRVSTVKIQGGTKK